jgi:hypothetical protein
VIALRFRQASRRRIEKIAFPKFFASPRKKLPECAGRSFPKIFLFGFA